MGTRVGHRREKEGWPGFAKGKKQMGRKKASGICTKKKNKAKGMGN